MNTRLKEIEAELRRFYDTDNDAPRLIRELLSRFPYPRKEGGGDDDLVTESERRRYESQIADLEEEISDLEDRIDELS